MSLYPQVCRVLFEDIMARSPVLSRATLLPAIVHHIRNARSGHVKADGIALLLAFLRSSKVHTIHPFMISWMWFCLNRALPAWVTVGLHAGLIRLSCAMCALWAQVLAGLDSNDRPCLIQGQQSATAVAEAFRSHMSVLPELAIAAVSGDVAESARQIEALKDMCGCLEQLEKVCNLIIIVRCITLQH